MDSEKIELSFIIVNYKTPHLTKDCISSINSLNCNFNYEIIVVDNYSNDNSYSIIVENSEKTKWIQSNDNVGFGRANNLGVSHSKGKFILLVNSDVVLNKISIEYYLDRLKKDSSIGVIGCKLLYEDQTFQNSTYYDVGEYISILKNNILFEYFFPYKKKDLDAIMGAFMLMKRSIFDESGGFDPDFFMYAEELELCKRIKSRGYKIVYDDKFSVIHKIGGSSEGNSWSGRQNWLSNALLFLKTKGYFGYFIYHFLWLITFFMNLFVLWKFDKNYRNDYKKSLNLYFSNFKVYFKIPFIFTPSIGKGSKLLKSA